MATYTATIAMAKQTLVPTGRILWSSLSARCRQTAARHRFHLCESVSRPGASDAQLLSPQRQTLLRGAPVSTDIFPAPPLEVRLSCFRCRRACRDQNAWNGVHLVVISRRRAHVKVRPGSEVYHQASGDGARNRFRLAKRSLIFWYGEGDGELNSCRQHWSW